MSSSSARVAVAAGSQPAADAGGRIAAEGGNAVDAAIAATLVLMISEPGVCAPGAGGFVTIKSGDDPAVTIDANVAMPGRDVDGNRFGVKSRDVTMAYGGGVTTTVGYESVAVPGGIAGLGLAWGRSGMAPWADVVQPAIDLARAGMPLSSAAHTYLQDAHNLVFGWHPVSHAALHDDDGSLHPEGTLIRLPGLVDTLETLAAEGADDMYRGSIAAELVADLDGGGSLVSAADLASYEPVVRPSATTMAGAWAVSTNPPPSIGGATLLAMLSLVDEPTPAKIIGAQERVLTYRRDRLDQADDLDDATRRLLDLSTGPWRTSPSTVHASAVDRDGSACAITMSAGYGSGVVAGSTGFWMNNSLGEVELNRKGFHGLDIGTRLPSNMAPTVAVSDRGSLLAIGSPGADRITTALQQVLLRVFSGAALSDAVAAPRLHVEVETGLVAHEPGLEIPPPWQARPFETTHMFFGGVAAALFDPSTGIEAAGDSRRTGGHAFA